MWFHTSRVVTESFSSFRAEVVAGQWQKCHSASIYRQFAGTIDPC
jgi:hypothetical protein